MSIQVSSAWGCPSGIKVTTVARFLPFAKRMVSPSSVTLYRPCRFEHVVEFDPTLGSLSNLAERARCLVRQEISSDLARMKSEINSQGQVPADCLAHGSLMALFA